MRLVWLAGLGAILAVSAASPAAASGGFWCVADDDNVAFSIEGGLGRSIPGPPFSLAGMLTSKLAGTPDDFKELELDLDDLAQSWFEDGMWLQIYWEREKGSFASIDLVIRAASDAAEEWVYPGTYTLTVSVMASDTALEATELTATGPVTCNAG